jgi:spermidine synthase
MKESVFFEKDPYSPINYVYQINGILHSEKSTFQDIVVLDTDYFGRVLVLDDVVQLTEKDEFFYHEMLSHVALHTHPSPSDILIIGGGDGGTLREVLKHESVRSVHLVEIDKRVIEVSKRFFPSVASGFSDKRVQVVEKDGSHYIKTIENTFDIIIIDSTDPVGSAKNLFTDDFFAGAFSALNESGIFVNQTESLHFHREFVVDVQQRLKKVFNMVGLYIVPLATYAGNWWTFSIASKKYPPGKPARRPEVETRYYDWQVHEQAFLPENLYKKLLSGELDW